MGSQKSKILLVVAVVVLAVAAFVGFGLVSRDEPQQATQSDQTAQVDQTPNSEVTYNGVEGVNALELLKQSHEVETKNYEGIGELVTSIDGVVSDGGHFWAFYVNDQQSQVGASAYITKDTDKITWKLEEIQ